MSGQEVAALIVAITGALAAIFAGIRNLRGDAFKKEVEASAALLTGYTTMVTSLQAEIDRLKSAANEDRVNCAEERARLRAEYVAEITRMREEHRAELRLAYERIDDLSAQVYTLRHRPPESRERGDDRP
jgi:hypothetical protein